jgi:CRISPR-associated protein Csd1
LVHAGVLVCGDTGKLLTEWRGEGPAPEILTLLQAKERSGHREKLKDQGDAFVRWRVEIPGDLVSAVWDDPRTVQSWIDYCHSNEENLGVCLVTGERVALSSNHPKRIRHSRDGAKLISSNDQGGFTFRGRFASAEQACGVGSEVTQKAHSALRWLIERQGYSRRGQEEVFVTWSIGGRRLPSPAMSTAELFRDKDDDVPVDDPSDGYAGDAGQEFARRLNRLIAGYRAEFSPTEEAVVMGLDAAVPGRLAIIFYRELYASEFLGRIQDWHERYAWMQKYSRAHTFTGTPAPNDIAEAAFGRKIDDKLRKAVVESLVPCIVDGRVVPRSLVEACVRRATNRAALDANEWEKCLGIACGLFRGSRRKENYSMSLEEERKTRDYLFGRILAIAEHIELRALYIAEESGDTSASKLMHRFADRPCSTWRSIEIALAPYRARLRAKRPQLLLRLEKELDRVVGQFGTEDFVSDARLSGEFLLGYHCQRAALWKTEPIESGSADLEESKGDE